MQLSFLVSFISLCRSRFPSGFIFLLVKMQKENRGVRNSFSFCVPKQVFISPLVLKKIFAGYRILG